ncbi:hypothetical protein LJC64_03785 [Ruminococcaceae bacterium OttesenSCG-928-A11]|nr:hypothetical protein [Ruminococcaceae bacterium OttesenSCG-928-A11]
MKTYRPHASSVGDAAANIISVTCYVSMLLLWNAGFIPILIIFFMEKKSGLVRFHAMQALLMWVVNVLAGGGIAYEGLAALLTGDTSYFHVADGWMAGIAVVFVRALVSGLVIFFSLAALGKAYRWQDWRIPFIGQLAVLIVRHCAPAIYNGEGRVPHGCERGYRDYARPEWKAKWERKDGEVFQDMLPPPPPPRPVLEAIRAGEDATRRRESPPPPPPRYAAVYDDEEIIDVDYQDVVEEPEAFDQQTLFDATSELEPVAPIPRPAPARRRPAGAPKPEPVVIEDPALDDKWYVEPMYNVDYNAQLPNYMRDPDPVTGWMEDPLPDYPVAPATTPPPRAAAPVPQNMKYSISEGHFFGRRAKAEKAAKPKKGRREDDPNDQLPDFMRDPPAPYDMY